MRRPRVLPVVLLVVPAWLAACGASSPRPVEPSTAGSSLEAEWARWRAERRESLAGPDGWLSLVALGWLDGPSTTVGSEPTAQVVLPADHAPPRIGRIELREGAAWLVPEPGVALTCDGAPIPSALALTPDDPGPPTVVELGPLRMHVIARAGRLGLRVKDRESPARMHFGDLAVFPYDPALRVAARFEPAAEGATLPIVNVLGQQVDEPLAGRLHFAVGGRALSLLATWAGETAADGLSVMLRDTTSDEGATYGGGRYLEVAAPDADGATWVDFNRAYTPPCGFTDFATCPLPPADNELPVAIHAGERAPDGH